MSALPVPALPPLDSTYGVWLVALLLESILYGMGLVQAWMYFMSMPTDSLFVQLNVLSVVIIETLQVIFFFHASYHRFVHRFAVITVELLWFDSVCLVTLSSSSPLTLRPRKLQLICAYLGAFLVQIFFAVRVFKLARGSGSTMAILAMYIIFALAIASIGTGIAQTAWTGAIGSFAELGKTKAVTTVQAATSLACDVLITVFLCLFLTSQKGEIKKTNYLLERLIFEAINRGILTALSSGVNLVLFLAIPDTFWFFLGLAPSSKLYMNSMLATLNMRKYTRDQVESRDKGWNSLPLGSMGIRSNVEFSHSRDLKTLHHRDHMQGFDSKPALDNVSVVDSTKDYAMQVRVDREVHVQTSTI
ncbi:hypothetical protein MKEN_00533600 [Mycena kentingensis (nom. inval.)]|nr:hypothetical protein MKEN_00533600 [Mycena kentingensis (nom. inval.)]